MAALLKKKQKRKEFRKRIKEPCPTDIRRLKKEEEKQKGEKN